MGYRFRCPVCSYEGTTSPCPICHSVPVTIQYPATPDVSWMSNPQYLAQVSHFLGGASLILLTALFSLARHRGWYPVEIAFVAGFLVAALKEFWFDIVFEHDSWTDSLMDFAFYVAGGGIGVVVTAIAYHL